MSILPLTLSVPEWGRLVLDIGENLSYDEAKRGNFITIDVGDKQKRQRKRVPVRVNLLRLAGNNPERLDALTRDLLAKLEKVAA
jgi:hypothetical protein